MPSLVPQPHEFETMTPAGSRQRRPQGTNSQPQGTGSDNKLPAGQKSRRGKKPKGQTTPQTQQDDLQSSAQDPQPEIDAYANGDPQTTAPGPLAMPEFSEVPVPHSQEARGTAPQGKKQPRKKSSRPKANGPFNQAAGIDINQPRHPPANASQTAMKPSDPRDQAQQQHTTTSEQRSPPPTGILGTTTTPAKLYAGPTFHASPAPSSLPVPKFLSKSAPSPDKGPDLSSHAPHESVSESSGSAAGDSPTMKSSLRAEIAQAREPSPLDVFFSADRQEKAKRNQETLAADRAQSSSPLLQASRSHSRQPTGSSIFPMEMEGAALPKTPNERRTESLLPSSSPDSNVAEKAKAKTEALKQLLQFGPRQTSSPLSQSASIAQSNPLSSSPRPASQPRLAGSGHSTPLSSYSQGNSPARTQGPFPPPPGPSLSPQGIRAPPPTRAYSSHLRHEVSSHDAVPSQAGSRTTSVLEPTASTVTPPHTSAASANPTSVSNTRAYTSNLSGPAPPSLRSLQAMSRAEQDALIHASLARHVTPSASAIEDELRKVLKITPLSTSTTS